jgi:hypothetical protein
MVEHTNALFARLVQSNVREGAELSRDHGAVALTTARLMTWRRSVAAHDPQQLSWRRSNSMDAEVCIQVLEEALDGYGAPEIFKTDQGQPVYLRRASWTRSRIAHDVGREAPS